MEHPPRLPVPEWDGGRVLRGVFEVRRLPPGRLGLAMTSALATGVPLAVGALTGRLSDGLTAALGAVTAIYFPTSSWGYRARALPVVAVGAAAAATVGGTAGGNPWRTAVAIAGVGFAATIVFTALLAPPPGPVPFVVTCAVATQLPAGVATVETRAGLTLAGATFAYLLTMAGARQDRAGPSRRVVVSALGKLAAMLETAGTPEADTTRHDAAQEIRRAEVIIVRDRVTGELANTAFGLRRVFDAGLAYMTVTAHRPPAVVAEQLREYAARVGRRDYAPVGDYGLVGGLSEGDDTGWAAEAGRVGIPVAGPNAGPNMVAGQIPAWHGIAEAIAELGTPVEGPPAPLIPRTRDLLAEGLRADSPAWPWAARCGVATFGAALLAIAVGIERPYWAPVAAAAVLEVRTARVAGQRTVQRAVGTGVGAVAAFALLAVPFPAWALIVIATLLQGGVQLANVANHALGSVLLTPLALLLVEFARPGTPVEPLIGPRVLDTLLGVLVGLAAALSLWPRAAAHRLPHALAECIDATGALLALSLSEGPGAARGQAGRVRAAVGQTGGGGGDSGQAVEVRAGGAGGDGADRHRPHLPGWWHHHDDETHRWLAARHHVEASLAWLSELHVDARNEPGETARMTWPAVVAARRLGYLVLVEPCGLRDAMRATPASPTAIQDLFDRLATGVLGDTSPPPRDPPQLPPFPPLKHEFAALVDATPADD